MYFEHLPLAFGGRLNVLSFNWVARALWWVLVVGLGLPITHYFDDFPCIVPEEFADFANEAMTRLMDLLGWELKPAKPVAELAEPERPLGDHGFASSFTCLGVIFRLSLSIEGILEVANKPGRIAELYPFACRLEPYLK